jgi:GT2 family glycosyltransferase
VLTHLDTCRVEPEATEFHTDLARLSPELAALLRAHEDSTTYQFVVRAEPAPAGGGAEAVRAALPAAGVARAAGGPPAASPAPGRLDPVLESLLARMAYLENERRDQALSLQEGRLRLENASAERDHWKRSFENAEAHAGRLDAERERLGRQRDHWRGEAERLGALVASIQSSAAWTLLERYRRLRLALIPRDSGRERLYGLGLGAVRRLGRSRPAASLGLRRRLQFGGRRARSLTRIAYRIFATQGVAELRRKTALFVRKRLRPREVLPPVDVPTLPELRRLFVRRQRPVAVIIPTYRQTDLVSRCVESILAGLEPAERPLVRVLVVDDGSGPDVQEHLRRLPVEALLRPANEGFARTVNAGIAATSTEDVVLLNNDTLAHPGWIEALQHCAYQEPGAGVLGAKLLYPDGRIQSAGSYRSVTAPEWFDHCYRFTPADHPPANVQREVLAVTGACMYIKRAVLDAIGPLDPGFAMAFEDVDYCLRARQAGFQVVYCPHGTLTHLEGHTRGERKEAREIRSQEYFWQKWGAHFDGRRVWVDDPARLDIAYVLQAGGHRVIFEHLNHLHDRGHRVHLYTLARAPKWFPLRAPVHTFPSYDALVSELARVPAIKVATWWETAERVWLASLETGIPVYLVQDIETSYYEHDPRSLRPRARVLASYRKEFHYLTDASWTAKQLQGLGLVATVVPPGIDHRIFRPQSVARRPDLLLSVGRRHPLKNLALTLEAYRRLARRPALYLFGIDPEAGQGLAERYLFAPTDEEVAGLYATATAFVLTSIHEGYGLPILEAWACGCPVICTDADGNMDFCRDGENCLIVPKDDPAHLARTIENLLGDPELQDRLRAGGFATVRDYTWVRATRLLEEFYGGVARERSRRG